MSRLLGHLTKQKRQKRKDVRGVKSSVSDAAGAMELWIAPNKQFCFQPSLDVDSDGDEVTSAGRLFHTRAAAIGNTRSRLLTGTSQARQVCSLMPSEDTAGRRGPPHTGSRWRGGLLLPTHQCSDVCGLVAEVGSVGFTRK